MRLSSNFSNEPDEVADMEVNSVLAEVHQFDSVEPYFREVGTGPALICIHAGYGSSGQWRSLTECLASQFRVITCDMSSSGKSPAISPGVQYTLDEEVAFLTPAFQAAGDFFHLLGHSFGGAVALKAALRYRGRVRSLTLFEPTLFALLVSSAPDSPAACELLEHTHRTSHFADLGDYEAAGELFVDYWFQRGAWVATREEVRAHIRARMSLLRQRWDALLRDPVVLSDVASIAVPVLCLTAEKSNVPARALSQLVIGALPCVRTFDIEGVGHMAPLSHPDRVNPLIKAFLEEVSGPQ
jgi:pimeloyl-ACP methyl ester carboxylesterase